ncbi:hypothetical protein Dda_2686 [Drechslerella dactyloides]|uniref:HNH nuclease domain-containing protein n=1 Tax=Drechslerella dactyloides TaxID=74499 RepID=A0AAD6J0W8_DREDA|nr:hypothetical protein Dda_2686 [Drechslerella dactyloides]
MSRYDFQLSQYRHDLHQSAQALTFAFSSEDPTTFDDSAVKISLTTPPGGPEDIEIRTRAVLWLEKWGEATAPPPAKIKNRYASLKDVNAGVKSVVRTYDKPEFLKTLYNECPSFNGKNNLAIEIILTVICKGPTEGRLQNIATVSQILNISVFPQPDTSQAFEQLGLLADELLVCMIQPLRTFGGKTPAVRSVKSNLEDYRPALDQGTEGRLSNLRTRVMLRDDFRCVVTGMISDHLEHEIPQERIAEQNLRFTAIECAHIIPHMLNELSSRLELSSEKQQTWQLLNFYSPNLSETLKSEKIDEPQNALMLFNSAHNEFGKLRLWFTRVGETNDDNRAVYRVEAKSGRSISQSVWSKDPVVVFEAREGIPLPSAYLLALHRALAIALTVSGAGEKMDSILDDYFTPRVLAEDGSSTEILETRLRLAVACL